MTLIGNRESVEDFSRSKAQGKLSHAFIIEGAKGGGKTVLARTLASALVCERENAPCGVCKNCITAMAGEHPDVHEVDVPADKTLIPVDSIRDIIKDAYVKPSESKYSVFIIENAHKMSLPSQNALLQVFEEPPQNTVFFLLTPDRNLLLKTLLSRARVIRCEILSEEQVKTALTERYPDKADTVDRVIRLSSGSLGEGIELMENEELSALLDLTSKYFEAVAGGGGMYSLSLILSPMKPPSREALLSTLSYFSVALRDVAAYMTDNGARLMFFTSSALPERISKRFTLKEIISAFDLCERITRRISSINRTMAIAQINSSLSGDMK